MRLSLIATKNWSLKEACSNTRYVHTIKQAQSLMHPYMYTYVDTNIYTCTYTTLQTFTNTHTRARTHTHTRAGDSPQYVTLQTGGLRSIH
jgi:hypothetical protein